LDSADTDTLLRHADQAMYVAKELGKNRVHLFDAENDRRVAAHREALAELHDALANNEFVLYYQPKVDLRSGEVIGAEALIRWRKPDGRIIPPMDFLPTLDGSALEVKVSMWVIETTMAQIARWKSANLPASISANLVASHLQQLDFLEWLELLLACYPTLEAGDLNLEILESAAIGDIDVVAERLTAVRALGVGVSLDDFGTGYSSLAYFRRLPIDTLKIDQGFVRDMLDDKEALGIVDSVVRLAAVFNRRVIAEGVETLEHWRTLLNMECDFGQGYGIARPMPAEQFPDWVAQWREHGPWREFVRDETRR
jgi:EAL domain-containing protein (putative c-di-GMP-specific phosphodiesterase class I)